MGRACIEGLSEYSTVIFAFSLFLFLSLSLTQFSDVTSSHLWTPSYVDTPILLTLSRIYLSFFRLFASASLMGTLSLSYTQDTERGRERGRTHSSTPTQTHKRGDKQSTDTDLHFFLSLHHTLVYKRERGSKFLHKRERERESERERERERERKQILAREREKKGVLICELILVAIKAQITSL